MTGDLVLPSRSVCLVAGIRLPCRTAKLEQTLGAAEAAAHLWVLCGSRSAPSGGVAGSGDGAEDRTVQLPSLISGFLPPVPVPLWEQSPKSLRLGRWATSGHRWGPPWMLVTGRSPCL